MATAAKPRQADIDAAAELAEKIKCPTAFAKVAMPAVFGIEFELAPHIAMMEAIILPELLDFSKKSYISISAPPRHGKSMFVQLLAAWFLMMFPTKRVIYVTYGDDLSQLAGKIVKKTVEKFGPGLFDVRLAKTAPVADWQLENSPLSGMLSVGIGSGITGRGGDLVIIDDVIKNALEANSKATKELHVREYDATIRSRVEPGGTLIMIATRWAEDDLPGAIRSRAEEKDYQGDPWQFHDFPAICEMPEDEIDKIFAEHDEAYANILMDSWTDMLGRKPGEALWPKRYDVEELRRAQASMDALVWASLYQQRPTVRSGGMFPKNAWKFYGEGEGVDISRTELMDSIRKKVWVWDTAFTRGGGDFTVGQLIGLRDDRTLALLELVRLQGDSAEVEKEIINAAKRTGPTVPILIEQERAGSGKYVVQSFQRLLPQFLVDGVKPEGEKDERAGFLSSIVIQGGFFLPFGADYIDKWVREFRAFPRGKHDDQVDGAVYAANHLLESGEIAVWSPQELAGLGGFEDIRNSLQRMGIFMFG